MPVDIRLTSLDGTTETHARPDLGEPANGVLRQPLQKLDGGGWWRSFRDSGTVDAEGLAVFQEDPTIPRIKNSVPRTLEGTVLDDHGGPLASAKVAIISASGSLSRVLASIVLAPAIAARRTVQGQ